MSKELPYFQFEPAEYLTKDISFCSLSAQGLFVNLCSYYWQRECKLTKDQFLRRLNNVEEFDELISEGVVDLIENDIYIKFLDIQYEKITKQSKTNSINGSKGGRPKKNNPKESESKANENPKESESKGIKEDKIKLYKNKLDNSLLSEISISDVPEELKKYFEIANSFRELFILNLKELGSTTKNQENGKFKNYVDPIRLMIEQDGVTIEQTKKMYKFLKSKDGDFWKPNILCTKTLRKQSQKLLANSNKNQSNGKQENKTFSTNRG